MTIRTTPKISPCLWFSNNAEEAVNHYLSIFKHSEIHKVSRYGKHGPMPEGTVLTIMFQLEGQEFMALNGGPAFDFSEAISFMINCETQEEIDYYWEKLSENGGEQQCGWLKDCYGVSWQVVPSNLEALMQGGTPEQSGRVMQELLKMVKLDMQVLQDAYDGKLI